ncbi:hypothetical protein ACLB1M_29030 [Escherichia coli]
MKAKIQAYQRKSSNANKRIVRTTCILLHIENWRGKGQKRYHVILLLTKITWCWPEKITVPSSLATLIQLAWCSAVV